jgi:hypothetical protein
MLLLFLLFTEKYPPSPQFGGNLLLFLLFAGFLAKLQNSAAAAFITSKTRELAGAVLFLY